MHSQWLVKVATDDFVNGVSRSITFQVFCKAPDCIVNLGYTHCGRLNYQALAHGSDHRTQTVLTLMVLRGLCKKKENDGRSVQLLSRSASILTSRLHYKALRVRPLLHLQVTLSMSYLCLCRNIIFIGYYKKP